LNLNEKAPGQSAPAFFDEETEENLLFKHVIQRYKPVSPFGKKAFLKLKPLNFEKLQEHFEFISKMKKCEKERQRIEHILESFHEVSESLKSVDTGRTTQVDLFEIKRFIYHHKLLKSLIQNCLSDYFGTLDDLWYILDPQNSGSYAFAPQNQLISNLTKRCESIQTEISKLYQERAKKINALFGIFPKSTEFLVARKEAKSLLNSDLVIIEKEGIKSYTFKLRPTEKILTLETELLNLEERLKEAQNQEIKHLTSEISKHTNRIRKEISKIVNFDIAFAQLRALKENWTFPQIGTKIDLKDAFHPSILESIRSDGFEYTTLTGEFNRGLTMIFGPNMGGKTTTLRTVGLVCATAMYGFLVPSSRAIIPKIDWIRYIGVTSGTDGLSGFASQITAIANVFNTEGRGLILIDEFGSGTNPYEGEALATAVAETLAKTSNFSIMVTHYRKAIESVNCKKYTVGRLNFSGEITMQNLRSKIDHHLVSGALTKMGDAIELSKILGLPEAVVKKAREILDNK